MASFFIHAFNEQDYVEEQLPCRRSLSEFPSFYVFEEGSKYFAEACPSSNHYIQNGFSISSLKIGHNYSICEAMYPINRGSGHVRPRRINLVTGRDSNQCLTLIADDAKRMIRMDDLVEGFTIVVGPGLSGLACELATRKHDKGLDRLVAIDPVDYSSVRRLVAAVDAYLPQFELFSGEYFGRLTIPSKDILKNLDVIADARYVDLRNIAIGSRYPEELDDLKARGTWVIDIYATMWAKDRNAAADVVAQLATDNSRAIIINK